MRQLIMWLILMLVDHIQNRVGLKRYPMIGAANFRIKMKEKANKIPQQMSKEESNKVLDRVCPDCGNMLLEGPCGGLSINVHCSSCFSRFNDCFVFGAQRI